jgi:hypothetical protein
MTQEIDLIELNWTNVTFKNKINRIQWCIKWLKYNNIPYTTNNYGVHIIVTIEGRTQINIWPTTNKMRIAREETIQGVDKIITRLKELLTAKKTNKYLFYKSYNKAAQEQLNLPFGYETFFVSNTVDIAQDDQDPAKLDIPLPKGFMLLGLTKENAHDVYGIVNISEITNEK